MNLHPPIDPRQIRSLVDRIAASGTFRRRARLQQFLKLIVEETLEGRGDQIKEYSIGVAVYKRSDDYDPRLDSTVRVEASKLRRLLAEYFAGEGQNEPVVLSIDKGGYRPDFHYRLPDRDGPRGDAETHLGVNDPYVRGRFLLYKGTTAGAQQSAAHYREAIERDSSSAKAYAELANSQNMFIAMEMASPADAIPRIQAAAQRAIELDATIGSPYFALTFTYCLADWDWKLAEETVRKGLDLSPGDALGYFCRSGLWAALSRHDESVEDMRQAIRIEPLSMFYNAALGLSFYHAGRYEEAIRQLKQVLELDANFPMAHLWLGLSYVEVLLLEDASRHLNRAVEMTDGQTRTLAALGYACAAAGNGRDARKILDSLRSAGAERYVSPVGVAAIEAALGETGSAFEALEAAYQDRSYALMWLNVDPRFARLGRDPRFASLLARQRLRREN